MDYQMSHIQIAGAGAGKTYGLAAQILMKNGVVNDHRNIFAITYTNSAKKNIVNGLKDQIGNIPENIKVLTVHSFLLEFIIFPYSKFILGSSFERAVSIPLSNEPKFKNYRLKKLNDDNIIHNEQVFKKAQMILNKKGKNKAGKVKVDIVIKHIMASVDSIFVDEAQDLDDDALFVFRILSEAGVYVYMVGDPKQAIKYPNTFERFCRSIESGENKFFKLLENNNETRRVPENHLKLSNNFCVKEQRQTSLNKEQGLLNYIFVDDKRFAELYELWKSSDCLLYINEKNTLFDTHIIKNDFYLPESVIKKMKVGFKHNIYNFDLWIESIIIEMEKLSSEKTPWEVLKFFQNKYEVILEKGEWMEMKEILTYNKSERKYHVSSIDRVKGLEANTCIFILDNSMFQYLTMKKTDRNKELNKLYVALTRSMNHLIFALDDKGIKGMAKSDIEAWFDKMDIPYLEFS